MSNSDLPQGNDVMPGASNELSPEMAMQGGQPSAYAYPSFHESRSRNVFFDIAEASKLTPQILILLINHGLKRNWKWALPLGLILGSVAFAALYICFPIKYRATAYIQIMAAKPYFVFNEKDRSDYTNFVNTQLALIKNPLILEKSLENTDVTRLKSILSEKNPQEWLRTNLSASSQGKSEFATISINTEVASDADKIVNAVLDAYFSYLNDRSTSFNRDIITKLTLEMNRQQSAANVLQNQIKRMLEEAAEAGGIAGRDGGMSGGMGEGESILRDVFVGKSRLIALRAELKMLKDTQNEQVRIPEALLENAIANDPMAASLKARRAELESDIERLKEFLQDDDTRIGRIKESIAQIDKQLGESSSTLREVKLTEMQRSSSLYMQQRIFEKEQELRFQEIYIANLDEYYTKQRSMASDRTSKVVNVSFQEAQLKRINAVLDRLSDRLVSLNTEMNAPAQIQLLKKATVPTSPQTKQRIPLAAIGAAVGLFFPFFLGIAVERIKPRLYHVSQIRRALPNIMIGEIMEPPVSWVHGTSFKKRLARYRESVHSWCTHLLLSEPYRSCRTLSVASVSSDDGKTFLAVQIAVAMAQMKSGPVLLIDGDMRVGRLHLLFGNEESGVGLADILSFRNRIGEAVVLNENEPNLHLLSCGNLDVSPYELLGDGRFRELLDALEQNYALILVVVPPVSHAAESLVMAASTDTTLLCVRQSQTILAAMEDVFRKLTTTGSSVDGIVVKDIPYSHMAGKDGGFADKLEQIRLSHLIQYAD